MPACEVSLVVDCEVVDAIEDVPVIVVVEVVDVAVLEIVATIDEWP